MDSIRQDLRDALDEVRPESIKATLAVAAEGQSCGDDRVCMKCESPPAHKDKLRYCGRCAAVFYCSKVCAKDDWPEHKLVCEITRKERAKALADHEARGGRKQDYNKMQRDAVSWCLAVPGLKNEIRHLAWVHRGESPFIHLIFTSQSDADGSDIRVEMIPRSFWDDDPRFLETFSEIYREQLRQQFGKASFCWTRDYVMVLTMIYPDGQAGASWLFWDIFDDILIRGVEIAEALTTATKTEDLADAFAWFENAYPSGEAQSLLQHIQNWASSVHGNSNTTLQSHVPEPSCALNTGVAYKIFDCLNLEFDVHLMGLRSAAHLNGRQGIIRGPEPGSHDRWKVRLDDNKCVSVKAVNLAHIRRGAYKRISP